MEHTRDPGQLIAQALAVNGLLDEDSAAMYGQLFTRFSKQHSRKQSAGLDMSKVTAPATLQYEQLERVPSDSRLQSELLKKCAILKLNGGLGTSMGCRSPKAAIPIKNGLTFLDLTVRQVEYLNTLHSVDVPLVLMNSFRTHDVTVRLLSRYAHHNVTIHCFSQSCFPRLDKDTFAPLPVEPFSPATESAWYPPGHGDVFRALEKSGVLDKLLASGKEYIFISNVRCVPVSCRAPPRSAWLALPPSDVPAHAR
jgi:UTP--glucose-1-phosphate uridylyltransferase